MRVETILFGGSLRGTRPQIRLAGVVRRANTHPQERHTRGSNLVQFNTPKS